MTRSQYSNRTGHAPRRPRRMARSAAGQPAATEPDPAATARPSKLALLEALLLRPDGASLADLAEATGWQAHSLRGAMAGALCKRGLIITSVKSEGTRVYRAGRTTE